MPSPSSAAASSSSASSAHDDLVARAIEAGIASHAELPARVRAALPASEWKARARHLLVRRGAAWGSSAAARGCCGEREYYEALVKHYLESKRVYPYHLAHFVSRVLRVTPPSYYASMLNATLKAGKPFASLPNFAAADASRTLFVGRNEFISAANASSAAVASSNPLGGGGGGGGGGAPSTPSAFSSMEDSSGGGGKRVALASRRGKAALESLLSAAAAAAASSSSAAAAAVAAAAAAASETASSVSSSAFSPDPPRFPLETRPWWRAHAVNVGEAEAASLSPEELSAARAAAAPGGVALSEVGFVSPCPSPCSTPPPSPLASSPQAAIESLYRRGVVYLSVPLTPEDSVSVPPLEGFVSNRGGIRGARGGGRGGGGKSGGGGGSGGGREWGGNSSSSDDDGDGDERRPAEGSRGEGGAGEADEDPVEPLLYALLVAAGGGGDDDDGDDDDGKRNGESSNSSSSTTTMTVRRLAEEILGLDLGAALAAASLAVRLGFARKGRGGGSGKKKKETEEDRDKEGDAKGGEGEGDGEERKESPSSPASSSSSPPPPSIALVVDAAVTSSLMAGALSPGLKTHAVSLFEGGRVSGAAVISDLLRELDATRDAAERFGAEGGIAELAADAAALAAAIRALRESASRGGGGGGGASAGRSRRTGAPRVELLRREALESSLPAGAAARLLRSQYSAVVSVSPAAPLAIVGGGAGLGGGGPGSPGASAPAPLFLGPRPSSTCSPLFSHLQLWAACGSGPAMGAVAFPSGLCLRKLPKTLEGAPAAALWCWRGGGDGSFGFGGGERKRARRHAAFSSRPGATPAAPRGLRASEEALLLGAGVARAPFLLRELNEALASRRSLGGGVLAVVLPSAAAAAPTSTSSLSSGLHALSLSSSSAAAAAEAAAFSGFSFADVALPLSPSSNSSASSSSPSSCFLEAVDPRTGEKVRLQAPPRWREAAKEMALSSCVGAVRFCRFPGSDGEEEGESSWFPLGIRLGIPLSPRPTCDAVCGALAGSDLMSAAGIERARREEEEREEAFARFVKGERNGEPSSPGLLLLPRAFVFDGKELKPASEPSASTEKGAGAAAAVLGRRCLQAPGVV